MNKDIQYPEELCEILINKFKNKLITEEEIININENTKGKIKNSSIIGDNKAEIMLVKLMNKINIININTNTYEVNILNIFKYLIVVNEDDKEKDIDTKISLDNYIDVIFIYKKEKEIFIRYKNNTLLNTYVDIVSALLFHYKDTNNMYFFVNDNKIKFNLLGDICFTLNGASSRT